ncbi:hypothetical protein Dsin_002056 [Dipteronia sinensis]|uniref:No apical meristem-associated C-terminal domain-containing protein n=1 Tax=Dipteronia sinensis TaxID=43782 RepID=A0AAE0B6F3_9ROSI|nr:hypothetical protein Dsin_002056 [Dipteronia sinensis]
MTSRTSSYSHAEDTHLCHVYLDTWQNPIIGTNQSKDMFWSLVETDYNNTKPENIDNDTATSAFRRQSGHFVSSQEDSPTSESLTTASPGLSSFSLNISSDDVGGSSSQRPVGVKKEKLKRRAEEESSKFIDTVKEGQQQLMEDLKKKAVRRGKEITILRRENWTWRKPKL